MVHHHNPNLDLDDEGLTHHSLIGVRYTGDRSSVPPNTLRRQAAWPGRSPFQGGQIVDEETGARDPGPVQLAFVPDWTDDDVEDRTVGAIEAQADFEVLYSVEDLAAALLERNYLPPDVFSSGYDPRLRELVFEVFDLAEKGVDNDAAYREQLREIAGIDATPDEQQAEIRDRGRVTEIRQSYPRPTLVEAARTLGHDDAEAAGIIDLAEWLADRDAETVRFALEGEHARARELAGLTVDDTATTFEDTLREYETGALKIAVKALRSGPAEINLRESDREDYIQFLLGHPQPDVRVELPDDE